VLVNELTSIYRCTYSVLFKDTCLSFRVR